MSTDPITQLAAKHARLHRMATFQKILNGETPPDFEAAIAAALREQREQPEQCQHRYTMADLESDNDICLGCGESVTRIVANEPPRSPCAPDKNNPTCWCKTTGAATAEPTSVAHQWSDAKPRFCVKCGIQLGIVTIKTACAREGEK